MSWGVEWPSSPPALAALGEAWEMTDAGVGHRGGTWSDYQVHSLGPVGEHQLKA